MDRQKPLWPTATLLALTGLNLLNYLDRQVLPAVLKPLQDDLGLTKFQAGFATTAFMFGYFATAPFFGYLGDRMSRKWLIAAGVFVWSIATVATGWAGGFLALLLFRVFVGVGEASYGTLSPSWIADLYPPAKRNNALSIFYVAIWIGSALGYMIGGEIGSRWGWRWAFVWAGLPGLLLAAGLLALREPPRGASDPVAAAAHGPPPGWQAYRTLLGIPAYVLVVAGYIAQTFAVGGFAAWAPVFLQEIHGMEFAAADHFFGRTVALTGLAATFLGGWLATLWQRRTPAGYAWLLGLSATCAAPFAVAAFTVPDAALARWLLAAAMFFTFMSTGPVNTLILETVPVAMRASAMAASIFAIHLFGDLWSPALVGFVADATGRFDRAVLLLPVALSGAAVFWLWLVARMRRPAAADSRAREVAQDVVAAPQGGGGEK